MSLVSIIVHRMQITGDVAKGPLSAKRLVSRSKSAKGEGGRGKGSTKVRGATTCGIETDSRHDALQHPTQRRQAPDDRWPLAHHLGGRPYVDDGLCAAV